MLVFFTCSLAFIFVLFLNVVVLSPRVRAGWLATVGVAAILGLSLVAVLARLAVPLASYSISAQQTYLGLASFKYVGWGAWADAVFVSALLPCAVFSVLLLDKPWARTQASFLALALLLAAGFALVSVDSLPVVFLSFELLLLSSLYLLQVTSKADRVAAAVAEMFFWTLAGSAALFVAVGVLGAQGVVTMSALTHTTALDPLVGALLIFGFCVKLPVWPCYSWLLRAHVEASVEFSILLSGVIVKFGVVALYRVLQAQPASPAVTLLAAACFIAVVEATLRLGAQRDLKRVVALTTVIEMNWLGFCLSCGGAGFIQTGALLLVAHSCATTGEFFLTEVLYRRYNTRDLTQLAGVYGQTPLLWAASLITVLTSIGFPCTSLFAAKVAFLGALASGPIGIFVVFTFGLMLVLPLLFVRVWAPVWFGSGRPSSGKTGICDLSGREAVVFCTASAGSLLLGVFPQFFLGVC